MQNKNNKQGSPLLRRLSLAAVLLAGIVVVLGAFTRLTHAGLGCPDWPGCYGFLTVPESQAHIAVANERFPDAPVEPAKGWAEMTHRYVAGSLVILVVSILVVSLRERRRALAEGRSAMFKLPMAILTLIVCQALFGMWTVTLKLWPQVVTAHLLGGFATLSLLFLLNLRLRPQPLAIATDLASKLSRLRPVAGVALALVILQIMLGGWTSSNYAALACPDLPTCQGQYLPPMDFHAGFNLLQKVGPNYLGGVMTNEARVAIHVTHRLGALTVFLFLSVLLWRLWRLAAGTALRRTLLAVAAALLLQIGLGLSNVFWLLPLPVAVAHNAGGALLLLSLIWLNERLHGIASGATVGVARPARNPSQPSAAIALHSTCPQPTAEVSP